MEHSTIAAIATPPGRGGIGIIRISGKDATHILSSIFRRTEKGFPSEKNFYLEGLVSHRLYVGRVIDPHNGQTVDEVLATVMKAPRTYTREDVVEIQSHSGFVVLNSILKLVLDAGAVLAQAGEFTKRAFLNGRIDLTQAEAVVDIINAKTTKSLEIASNQLQGNLGKKITEIRETLRSTLAGLEAAIDFPEDIEDEGLGFQRYANALERDVVKPLENLHRGYRENVYFRDGIRMVVVGRPNVGKSSLLNRLLEMDRAIVAETPGTTRDTIEEMINIEGLPVIIVDTAGLHETDLEIEKIGIERTRRSIDRADIVLFVVDLNQPITNDDLKIYSEIENRAHIVVLNKSDLKQNMTTPSEWENSTHIKISVLKNQRIDQLKKTIFSIGTHGEGGPGSDTAVPNTRHAGAMKNAIGFVTHAVTGLRTGVPMDFAALDLEDALRQTDEILGLRYGADVLDIIFSQFCIGK